METMDLTNATSQMIGSALDRAGVTWNYDGDGDIKVRFRSTEPPGTDVVFYEFDTAKADFSIRGQFLNARATRQADGATRWEVPADSVHEPTAVAQKVVTAYLMPRLGRLDIQVHASIAPLAQQRSMHLKVIPGREQISRIEKQFSGFVGTEGNTHFWMSSALSGTHVDELAFRDAIRAISLVGIAMFDGPLTGWMYSTEA